MKIIAPSLACAALLTLGGCPAPEEPATTPREPVRPAPTETQPTQPTPQQGMSDSEIRQQIDDQMQQAQGLSSQARNITVEVRNGTVTLRGEVQSQSESQRIEDMALQIDGVQDVNNQLRVNEMGNMPQQDDPAQPSPSDPMEPGDPGSPDDPQQDEPIDPYDDPS